MRRNAHLLLLLAAAAAGTLAAQTPHAGRPTAQPSVGPSTLDLRYRSIGPTRGGRVTAVTGVPGEAGTFYLGATGGGVWKTTDYGQNWRPVSDGFFATGSIGAIRVAPSRADRVYVGTGSDGIRSNVILGKGVYRSDDAGKTWQHLGLETVGQIGAVEVHPTNPDIAWVAAIGQPFGPNPDRGVYRTRDGGKTWEKVLFVSDSTGAVDLELAPGDPNTVYAAMWRVERKPWTIISGAREGGIWKSADGGSTWRRLGGGLPTGLVGKADLAVTPAAPNRLYVLIEAAPGGGLYRSDDRGETFRLVSAESGLLRRPFYYTNVDADPSNPDLVYVNNESFFKSMDGGATWTRPATPHGDNHDMWIDPADPRVMIQSNDGGANVTRDGGQTWSTQENQPTAELYQVALDDRFPAWAYAGQQDNTTIAVPLLPPFDAPAGPSAFWRDVGGCETGPAVPKPGDPDVVYSNCKGQFGRFNQRTGQEQRYWVGGENLYGANPKDLKYRFQRVVPVHVSPHDPNTVYHGSQYLHRTRDGGITWERISPDLTANEPDKQVISGTPITRDVTGEEYYSTLYAVRESPVKKGVIWTGANDGPVHVTRDGGKTWAKVTPPLPPGGRVQNIEPSPHDAARAYVAIYRYLLNDWQPYLYRTTDYGATWTRLTTGTNGIPADQPTRVVREDPSRPGLLYAGTESGMYVSSDDGGTWQPLQLNLPVTPVTDIAFMGTDLVLSTMGRGFWVLDNLTPLRQLADGRRGGAAEHHLFTPREALRLRYQPTRQGASPEYPAAGAQIDYIVGTPGDTVRLEFLDATGAVIRSFTSGAGATMSGPSEQGMRGPPQGGQRAAALAGAPGHHRFTWDLRYPGPDNGTGRTTGQGPMVAPGRYQVRLSIGAWTATQPLVIRADPRVTADGVTDAMLAEQAALALRVRDLASEVNRTIARLREVRRATPEAEGLAEAERALVTAGGSYPTPMLLDQVMYLYSMVSGADQKPGRDASERLAELAARHEAIVAKLRAVAGWDR